MNLRMLWYVVTALGMGIMIGFGLGDRTIPVESGGSASAPPTSEFVVSGLISPPAAEADDWCAEHRVPESECTLCNPQLISDFRNRGDWCAEHGMPESHCRLCNPNLEFASESKTEGREITDEISVYFPQNAVACATDGAVIQFASTETAARAGIETAVVLEGPFVATIEAPAEVRFDEMHMTLLTSTVPVTITRWRVNPGEAVQRDQIIADAFSSEVATLRGDYLTADAEWDLLDAEWKRKIALHGKALVSTEELQAADAAARRTLALKARVQGLLTAAGAAVESIDALADTPAVTAVFPLRATESGTLIERRASPGQLQPPGTVLGVIADPAHLWIEAQLQEGKLSDIHAGQRMEFVSDGRSAGRIAGEVIWVSRFLDPFTRTGVVRAHALGGHDDLRSGEFGRAIIYPESERSVVLVPRDAVQWEGCCNVVFVQEAVGRYRPRKVRVAESDGGYYRIVGDVRPGEQVVDEGSFLLKTELKKTSIGAGCCGLEPTS